VASAKKKFDRQERRESLLLLAWAGVVLGVGVLGFTLMEGVTVTDAFFMTVLSVTTVGFDQTEPLSNAGKLLTIFLIFAGGTSFFLAGGLLVRAILLRLPHRDARRMQKTIDSLSDHLVVCGSGRLGNIVRSELQHAQKDFVVIEKDEERAQELMTQGVFCVTGDATDEAILSQAGVARAAGVITAIGTDADNVFVTLTVRQQNPTCPIIARTEDPRTEQKLLSVGATSVVTPAHIGGRRLAQAFLRPGAVDLADLALGDAHHEVLLEEVSLPSSLDKARRTLLDLEVGSRYGLMAVGVRSQGALRFNPRAGEPLAPGDTLLVLGHRVDIDAFCHTLMDASEHPRMEPTA